jgi:hypothetical protein
MNVKQRYLPAVLFILLLAAFLRFHLLETQSFWNDEGNSARLSERSLSAIIEGTASDIHPPFYYLILRGWRELAGETEFGLRSLSTYAGILTVAGVMALAKFNAKAQRREGARDYSSSLASWRPGVLALSSLTVAGLLAAVSPVLVYYSQETRMYALLGLLAVLSGWALLQWLNQPEGRLSPGWAIVYTASLAAGLYTHYFFPAVIVAHGAMLLFWWSIKSSSPTPRPARFRRLLSWMGLAGLALLLYLPWTPIFLRQIGGRPGAPSSLTAFLRENSRWLFLGSTTAPGEAGWAIVCAVALVALGILAGRRRSVAIMLLAFVPLLLMFLAGATDPAFFKFLLVVVPFLMVLMGVAWRWRSRWIVVPTALTVAVITGSLISLGNLYTDPAFARADYRGMAGRITAEGHPNAGIILNAPNQWEVFTYYHQDGAPVYPLPRSQPDPAILELELDQIIADHDRLYVLYWGDAQRDPQHVVERWLNSNTFKVSEEWVGDVRFVVYASPSEVPTNPRVIDAPFSALNHETIHLHEFAVWPTETERGDTILVQLTWSADTPTDRPYKVFLHLLDSNGTPVAQRDGEPVGGSRPTTGWEPGEVIVDRYGLALPSDLPPGEYLLRMGLYDMFDPGTRLIVNGEDSLQLATILVR